MALSAGTCLGPYEIVAFIGAGGMGEVYRARDSRLGRDVAVKVLPSNLNASAVARQRFQREATAVAALQHPNICTVFDVGETDEGAAFLVMELLHGEPLDHRLRHWALDINEAIEIGSALADALETAHAAGHRPSRHQTGQYFLDRARAEDSRLRAGQIDRAEGAPGDGSRHAGRGGVGDGGREHSRHDRLHVARTTARRRPRPTDRPLFPWARPLRDGERAAGVHRRHERGDQCGDSAREADGATIGAVRRA